MKDDWKLVMSYNPKSIYYAHANVKYCKVKIPVCRSDKFQFVELNMIT